MKGLVVSQGDSVGGRSSDIAGKLAGYLADWVVCGSARGFASTEGVIEGFVLPENAMAVVVARLM